LGKVCDSCCMNSLLVGAMLFRPVSTSSPSISHSIEPNATSVASVQPPPTISDSIPDQERLSSIMKQLPPDTVSALVKYFVNLQSTANPQIPPLRSISQELAAQHSQPAPTDSATAACLLLFCIHTFVPQSIVCPKRSYRGCSFAGAIRTR